jgi:ribosomal protein L37AE/L43A
MSSKGKKQKKVKSDEVRTCQGCGRKQATHREEGWWLCNDCRGFRPQPITRKDLREARVWHSPDFRGVAIRIRTAKLTG